LIFYTGVTRDAADILADQVNLFEKQDLESVEMMHGIKRVGLEIRAALLAGDLPSFGQLLGEHWNLKRRFSHKISNSKVDRWYECALREGATGGKLMGAGGGGFLLLYCEPDRQAGVLNALRRQGLRNMPFEFDFAGTKVLPI